MCEDIGTEKCHEFFSPAQKTANWYCRSPVHCHNCMSLWYSM